MTAGIKTRLDRIASMLLPKTPLKKIIIHFNGEFVLCIDVYP